MLWGRHSYVSPVITLMFLIYYYVHRISWICWFPDTESAESADFLILTDSSAAFATCQGQQCLCLLVADKKATREESAFRSKSWQTFVWLSCHVSRKWMSSQTCPSWSGTHPSCWLWHSLWPIKSQEPHLLLMIFRHCIFRIFRMTCSVCEWLFLFTPYFLSASLNTFRLAVLLFQ